MFYANGMDFENETLDGLIEDVAQHGVDTGSEICIKNIHKGDNFTAMRYTERLVAEAMRADRYQELLGERDERLKEMDTYRDSVRMDYYGGM